MAEFVAQERIQVELGPQRLALAVNDGDLAQLTAAMRAASSMWGGRRFPILPVNDDAELVLGAGGLLDILQTTSVIDFTGRLIPKQSVHSGKRMVPVHAARPLDDARQWTPPAVVSHTLESLRGVRLVEAVAEDPFEVAAIGRLACRDELDEWAQFGAVVDPVTDEDFANAQLDRRGVVDATLHGTMTTMTSGAFGTSIVVVHVVDDEASFKDLLLFWNTRAIRPGEDGADLLLRRHQVRPNAAQLSEYVRQNANSTPSLALLSLSVPKAELRDMLGHMGIAEQEGTKWVERVFGEFTDEPTAVINIDPRGGWAGERHVGAAADVVAALYRPATTLTVPAPLEFAPLFSGSGPIELRLRSPMFEVPRRQAVARLYHNKGEWSDDSLLLPERLQRGYDLELRLPAPEQILAAAAELPYQSSDKARQLRAVLARESVDDLLLYRNPVALAVIEALMSSDSRQLRRDLQRVPEPDRDYIRAAITAFRERERTLDDIATDLDPPGNGATPEQVAAALNQLVDRGHVHRGFRADCTLCDTRELRQLHEAVPAPTCRACGAVATYVLGGRAEPGLFYRLSPVMRIICANGGLPVLAAAAVLVREGAHLLPGAEVQVDDANFEVDLLGWSGRKVLAGEAKRKAAGFVDVERDVWSSKKFGADVHIVTTLETVGKDLRERMEATCRSEGLQLRILDAAEVLVTG